MILISKERNIYKYKCDCDTNLKCKTPDKILKCYNCLRIYNITNKRNPIEIKKMTDEYKFNRILTYSYYYRAKKSLNKK